MFIKETEREKIFRLIFQEVEFPLLSIDLMKLRAGIESKKDLSSFFGFDIDEKEPKHDAIRGAYRGVIKNIEPTKMLFDIVKNSEIIKDKLVLGKTLKEQIESADNSFFVFTKNSKFYWEEQSYWPLAYSTFFQQIVNITNLYKIALSEREKELVEIVKGRIQMQISPEFPRNMPTVIHYAFASLGAWIGGASSVQFFSLYACSPQIKTGEKNIKYSLDMGYSQEEAESLTESGIISIPPALVIPLYNAQDNTKMFGSLPIEEFNAINFPPKETLILDFKEHVLKTKLSGLILDKYYRTPFIARRLTSQSLYGPKDVLRDHYTEFYNSIEYNDTIRCKHYCAPVVDVNSLEEAKTIIARIPERGQGGLFFRGQTSFYDLKRSNGVKRLLFGDSTSLEPSLLSLASRNNYNYDKLHFTLKYFLGQELLFKNNASKELFKKWNEMSISPTCKYDLALMALAQHYGFSTNGLDVTTNIEVAVWFATNKYLKSSDGFSKYEKLNINEWNSDKTKWPVVFVFQTVLWSSYGSLQDCLDLNELGIIGLRPERQFAKFFLGGHGDHQNRLAESVVCALRLCPNIYQTDCDFDYLFPNPDFDPAYKILLDISENEDFKRIVKSRINEFHR